MLSISTPKHGADAAVQYYLDGKLDYYLHGIDKEGQWHGNGAQKLGLSGKVNRETFRNLLEGFSPDGTKKLVQNAGAENRQCYWDLTFSAPKSVSVLWAMAPESVRNDIEQAHTEAVREALAYLEEVGGFSRRGKGGKIIDEADLVFATFLEGTSRAGDPNIHTHCVLVNFGVRPDRTTGALKTEEIFDHKMAGGEFYQLGLGSKLHQRLHVTIEPERVGFRIVDVPKDVCRFFSKRGQKIREVMETRGLKGAIAAKQITLETRPAKEEVPAAILFSHWQAAGRKLGWGTEQAAELLRLSQQQTQPLQDHVWPTGVPLADAEIPLKMHAATRSAEHLGGAQTTETSSARDQHHEKQRASSAVFQKAIDQILADHYVPPNGASGISQESTTQHSEGKEARQDKQDGRRHTKQEQKRKSNSGQQAQRRKQREGKRDDEKDRRNDKQRRINERAQNKINKEFMRIYLAMLDRMHPEIQTRTRLTRLAWWLGRYMGADTETIEGIFDRVVPGAERPLFHTERPRLFPNSPIKNLNAIRVPKLALGNPTRRWTKTHWKLNLLIAELRIQNRRLVPRAPRWSPLHGIEFPALRLAKKPADLLPVKPKTQRDQGQQHKHENTR